MGWGGKRKTIAVTAHVTAVTKLLQPLYKTVATVASRRNFEKYPQIPGKI